MSSRAILYGWPLGVGRPSSIPVPPIPPVNVFDPLPSITLAQVGQPVTYSTGTPPAGYTITKLELIDANGNVLATDPPLVTPAFFGASSSTWGSDTPIFGVAV